VGMGTGFSGHFEVRGLRKNHSTYSYILFLCASMFRGKLINRAEISMYCGNLLEFLHLIFLVRID